MAFDIDKTRNYATLDRLYTSPLLDCDVKRPGLLCRLKALLGKR